MYFTSKKMETKKCKECGRELPLNEFKVTRFGDRTKICKYCIKKHYRETRYERAKSNKVITNYSDPDFDGKLPVEVLQMMKRAKMWLEAQGYSITLKGTYTQVREVKF